MTQLPLSQSAARAFLDDKLPLIGDCLRVGADRFSSVRNSLGPSVTARSQASLIHDFAAEHAEVVFADVPGVATRRCQELLVLDFAGRVFVRFRKLGDGWRFSRNDTNQTRLWEAQQPLEGMEQATNLVAGYRLDETAREIELAALVCTMRGRYQWHIEMPVAGAVVYLPATLAAAAATVRSDSTEGKDATDRG